MLCFYFFAFLLSLRVDLLPKWFLSGDERDSFTQNVFPNLFIAFKTEKTDNETVNMNK